MYAMKLSSPHFEDIESGRKKYENRVNEEKRQHLKKGDIITMSHDKDGDRKYEVRIVNITKYKYFDDVFSDLGLENVLPGVRSVEEGVKLYESIQGYEFNGRRLGVLCFELERV
jgi:ASC-1-like (ASCH) protein